MNNICYDIPCTSIEVYPVIVYFHAQNPQMWKGPNLWNTADMMYLVLVARTELVPGLRVTALVPAVKSQKIKKYFK